MKKRIFRKGAIAPFLFLSLKENQMKVRFKTSLMDALMKYCRDNGVSTPAVITAAIEQYIQQKEYHEDAATNSKPNL